MPSSRELLEQLKAADRSLSKERMPRASSRRVARRIAKELDSQSRPSRMGWIPMLTFIAGAALVLLFLRWGTQGTVPSTSNEAEAPAMKVSVSGPACRSQSEKTTKAWGACSISTQGPSMRIDTVEATHLEIDDRVVHLRSGSALFDVDPVRGDPIRVAIPQGEIVVIGTRFRVVVGETRSEIELYEGRLEFDDASGTRTPILAGQVVGFGAEPQPAKVSASNDGPPPEAPEPDAAEPAAEPEAAEPEAPPHAEASPALPRPAPKRVSRATADPPPTELGAGPVIEAAERLRREGRYSEAAATLRTALKRRWPTRTADVLSYELGRLLQRRIRDQASACDHWRDHLKRFEKTRYRTRIERSMRDLGCEPPSL